MDELIEILIRLIAGWLSNKPAPRQAPPPIRPAGSTPVPPPVAATWRNAFTPQPAMKRTGPVRLQAPPVTRGGRRRPVAQPPVMVAEPILTDILGLDVETIQNQKLKPKPASASVSAVKSSSQAKAIRGWMTPQSLKKQFILTELLQPPLSLREPK